MSLGISPSTNEERKQLFAEILLSKTDKVNKISDNSVLNGISYGVSKVSGKAEKDVVLAVSKLFPDTAFGNQLDQIAEDNGVPGRFGASQSSTYVRVVGDVGTQYIAGIHTFSSVDGIEFDIEQSSIIGSSQFNYIKVRSVDGGLKTNVNPATINKVAPSPIGHRFVANEYQAIGGRDVEDDITLRQRIREGVNILSRGTISMLEQVFMKINSNVLKLRYQGVNANGQLKIAIITQNGIALNASELNALLVQGEQFFGLSELRPFGRRSYGIELVNIDIQTIDISFRCELFPSFSSDDVRVNIQTNISKYLDFRNFRNGIDKIEWVNLLEIVKNTDGIKFAPDNTFYPNIDIPTDPNKIVRLRGFLMLNLQGGIINTSNNTLSPVYYPQVSDFNFQQTVLRSI